MFNHGNTCFLNSTLQCLLHTPPLVQILQSHSPEALKGLLGKSSTQPSISEYFQRLVIEAWSSSGKAISPRSMVQNIRRVGRQFRPSRQVWFREYLRLTLFSRPSENLYTKLQEDAHEYLRQLLDCMHEEVLKANGVKVSDGLLAETTFISRIFGGYLCNELRCLMCKHVSKTSNHFQDMSLDIVGNTSSVREALRFFLKSETLASGNEWLCSGCNKKVKVQQSANEFT